MSDTPKNKYEIDAMAVINDLAEDAHRTATENGFHEGKRNYAVDLVLIHSETSEAVEALRAGESPERVAEEVADIVIRALDMGYDLPVDFGKIIIEKMEKNKGRPWKHGKKF